MWRVCLILLCLDVLMWSCQGTLPPPKTLAGADIIEEVQGSPFDFNDIIMTEWGIEAVERFGPGVVVAGAHGSYSVDGIWLCYPTLLNGDNEQDRPWDIYKFIAYLEAEHPGHKIVLLCCNIDHTILHGHPNVYYSPEDNFLTPTRFAPPAEQVRRQFADKDVVGDIGKFIQAK